MAASPPADPGYPPIGDYAVIGDCRTAALVSRTGSLDWLCLPRFDSPALFGALLDRRRGGSFSIRPTGGFESTRRYLGETNILETEFRTPHGCVRLVDLMAVASEREKSRTLRAEREVLRRVECTEGEVEIEVLFDPRPDFGRRTVAPAARGRLGILYDLGGEAVWLRSEIELAASGAEPGLRGKSRLRRGERRALSLSYAGGEPGVLPLLGEAADARVEESLAWWRAWSARCRYEGPHRDAVVRSALVLKLMSYAPSGAVVAAPTTSLPEKIGGPRNWDYRFCWLRDASLTLQALIDLGYGDEAASFLSWLLSATRLRRGELQVLYDVHGESRLPERILDHLEGYAGSRPVRVGNGAEGQLQLDTYGHVVDAAYEFARRGGRLDRSMGRMLVALGRTVSRRWREPDEGIWEIRSGRLQHTYSKVACWLALDRLLALGEEGKLDGVPAEPFAREREAIRETIEREGYDPKLASYVSVFGGSDVDASLLLLGRYGYAGKERLAGTWKQISQRLGLDGLMYRYRGEDGLPAGEGAFGICSFWAVDCLCRLGRIEEARERLDELCGLANDVGLFAEEIDPGSGSALGNFPQAFTHVGLIDAALILAESLGHTTGAPSRSVGPREKAA
jgi:GH15 family glucan-1,4-alpha-glucosidase